MVDERLQQRVSDAYLDDASCPAFLRHTYGAPWMSRGHTFAVAALHRSPLACVAKHTLEFESFLV